jgi:Ca2+-binding RTX toxin-like protein
VTVSLALGGGQNTFGAGNDQLIGFENLTGSDFADILTGSAGPNEIQGLKGNDALTGGDGNDTLEGGGGNDTINGGNGADVMTGGSTGDEDRFIFAAIGESTPANPDTINGFEHGMDRIHLAALDANIFAGGNQAFLSATANASVVANSVTWFESGGNTIVQADVNGNAVADFVVVLSGTGLNLAQSDFIL